MSAETGSTLSLTSPAGPHVGDGLQFHWTTDAPHPLNWIGIYDGTRQPGDGGSLIWDYVTEAAGDKTFDSTALKPGDYTAYLLAKDGYGILAQTPQFTVGAASLVPPRAAHAVIDSFTTGASAPRGAVSVPLAPLWVPAQGKSAGALAFRRLGGDSWLSVRADGTVTGTAPSRPSSRPGRITVGVKDSAGGSDTVTVQVPVSEERRLTVATLNLWDAGKQVNGALEKQLRVILGQGLDVVAVQESGGTSAKALADALGRYAYDTPAGVGIVSRFPLSELSAPVAGVPAVAGTLRLPDGSTVRLWAAQLDEAGYGPYALRDGRSPAQVEAAELKTLRYQQAAKLLAAMRSDLASHRPVVLAAGLASPSHLDDSGRNAVRWPVTVALGKAGLTDAYREAHAKAARDAGVTWSPVRPDEPQDRIDQLLFSGPLRVESAYTLSTGWPLPVPGTAANGWPSDHAAPVITFSLTHHA